MKAPNWKQLVKAIPPWLQVGKDRWFEVLYTKEFREGHVGETRPDSNQIIIQMGHTPKYTIETYLHELLHAISDEHDVSLTEGQIMKLEKAFTYILRKNNVFISK